MDWFSCLRVLLHGNREADTVLANRAVNAGSVTLLVPSGTLRKLQSFNAKPFDFFKS